MSNFSFDCPFCHKQLQRSEVEQAGQVVVCPHCGEQYPAPPLGSSSEPMPKPANVKTPEATDMPIVPPVTNAQPDLNSGDALKQKRREKSLKKKPPKLGKIHYEDITINATQIRTASDSFMLADITGVHILKDTQRVSRWIIYGVCWLCGCYFLSFGWFGKIIGFGLMWLSFPFILGAYSVFVSTKNGRRKIIRFGYFDPFADGSYPNTSCGRAEDRAKAVLDQITDAIAKLSSQSTTAEPRNAPPSDPPH